MVRWQSRARVAVGAFGIACAGVVYLAIGERQRATPLPGVERIDPAAVLEMGAGELQQTETHGAAEVGKVSFQTNVTYADGSSKLTRVHIETASGNGRTYVVTSEEAWSARDSLVVELRGDVHVRASDGFELTTASGSYHRETGLVQTSEPVSFSKDRMAGGGHGMTYDQGTDILRIFDRARITIGRPGAIDADVSAGAATLDRTQHLLTLDRDVRVLDGEQSMQASRAVARLSADDQHITFVELRGDAAVAGGPAIEHMRARDIDLDYADDRRVLERVVLAGHASARTREGTVTREFAGDLLDVTFGADGGIREVVGYTGVRVTLPGSDGVPDRMVEAATLQATATEGRALERMRFEGDVVFRERVPGAASPRTARAAALAVALDGEGAVGSAVFTGGVTFEDADLTARAAEGRYEPARGVLRLGGTDARGEPRVDDDRLIIDAQTITVGLDDRRIDAAGRVKTTVMPDGAAVASPAAGRSSSREPTRLPGLLANDQAARVTAERLLYDGSLSRASYSGAARLWQKETELRADTMDIDLRQGDLTARGAAEALLVFESGRSRGSADEIMYSDASRRITYASVREDGGEQTFARIDGPEGDVKAGRIEVFLAPEGGTVDRVEAYANVEAMVDDRRATGDRLTYHAPDERYVVTGGAARPASVRFAATCQEIAGRTLTFSRTADTMQVDGGEELRTETRRESECR